MNKTLTVFTPAYNRAHTIRRTYKSLCEQTCDDFEWLVIDDGSTDNTRQLVEGWIKENKIPIRYIYQQNQGMHGAHNTAYANITTELNTCIDSDDYMPKDAVRQIVTFWKSLSDTDRHKYAGIVGLDVREDGQIIGQDFPKWLKHTTTMGFYALGIDGDKKLVYRTDVIKKYPPYPLFKGERYVGLDYKYILIDLDYELLILNEPLVVVDYQLDGSSSSMFKQYWNNPQGFSFYRKEQMKIYKSYKMKFRACIHYVAMSLRMRNDKFLKESPYRMLTILAIPLGVVLYFYVKKKVKNNQILLTHFQK